MGLTLLYNQIPANPIPTYWKPHVTSLTIEDLGRLPLETIAIYLCLKAMATLILVIKLYLQL